MTDYDAFQRALDADPTNSACRLILADWLDERGRYDEAAAWRWLGENGKWPQKVGTIPGCISFDWNSKTTPTADPSNILPNGCAIIIGSYVYDKLDENFIYSAFPSRLAAEEAFVAAFPKLREKFPSVFGDAAVGVRA